MNGLDNVKEKMDNTFTPETHPHREMLNEIPISRQGPKGGNAQFLQDAERNAAYLGKFKPVCFREFVIILQNKEGRS